MLVAVQTGEDAARRMVHQHVQKGSRLAAEQGHSLGQLSLGLMHLGGFGMSSNKLRAHMWFNLGAAAGNAEALRGRDLVASRMKPQQITRAQNLARECQESKFRDCD